jgi:hypothetical protein
MERIVHFSEEVDTFLQKLVYILFENHYFSFRDVAQAYVDKISFFAEEYVGVLNGKDAPLHFVQCGHDLKYITYRANKTTLWYIFYRQQGNKFVVCHITNNHVAAKYF